MRRSTVSTLLGLVASLTLVACASDGRDMAPPRDGQSESIISAVDTAALSGDTEAPHDDDEMTLYGPWLDGDPIPIAHTCGGIGSTPALSWVGVPPETVTLALVVLDTTDTSVDAVGRAHWIAYNIDPTVSSIEVDQLPAGAVVGANGFSTIEAPELAWRAPCPPAGESRTYVFEVHALDQQIELPPETPAGDMIRAIDFATLATASLTGTVFGI